MLGTIVPSLEREEEVLLVRKAQAGDFDAFERLVKSCERRIWAIAWRMMGVREEAENVVQTAFLKAMEALDGFRGDSSFCTWVGRIATNEGLELLRRRRHREMLSLDELASDPSDDTPIPLPELLADLREDPSRGIERDELRRILDRSLDSLTPGLRAVFVLRDVEGRSTAEAAEALGITEGNVKVRLLRARLALRELLTAALGGEDAVRSHMVPHGMGGMAAAMEARA
jgi:RNA polymerase sigma-70 factor (ECF subfamily)